MEVRFTKILSQEFSRTDSRILGALSKLGELLLNPQVRTFSGSVPGPFRNADVEIQEPNRGCSQNDPHHEVEFSACRASNLTDSDPDETCHMVTSVQEEIPYCSLGLLQENKRRRAPQVEIPFTSNAASVTSVKMYGTG